MISFSTSSYTVTVTPFSILTSLPSLSRWDSARPTGLLSTICFTRLPSLSLRATLVVTLTVSKLSFSFTARAISPSTIFCTSLALASVVTILPLYDQLQLPDFLTMPFSDADVLPSFLYFAMIIFLSPFMVHPAMHFGLTYRMRCFSPFRDKPHPNTLGLPDTEI